ncbi:hypothetical protein AJ80_07053 [Polytolypa hystricis UAMH7299]|uniref:Uncharacterized protein n=1 Tax=Polytolypa hystricis (strain UAMH7299) TaxID=1447883 RepID=A0A2B7XS40_POLH7|nr:hypothetical protein AJ80_07053 [Polytolypa hystricis UAMH7299]
MQNPIGEGKHRLKRMPTRKNTNLSLNGPIVLESGGSYADPGELPTLNVKDICKDLTWHISFPMKEGYEIKHLPKFNDLTTYGVPEAKELEIWDKEVERLVRAVESESPPRLNARQDQWGAADREGYTKLHKLALQLNNALDICTLDNELILLESAPGLQNMALYERAHRRLAMNFDLEHGEPQYEISLRLESMNNECLHDLVDYITAVMARIFARAMKGDFWMHNCIRGLATLAAKVKVLIYNLTEAATTSLAEVTQLRKRLESPNSNYALLRNPFKEKNRGQKDEEEKKSKASQGAPPITGMRYFMIMDAFYRGGVNMWYLIMNGLFRGEGSALPVDHFETSALIYDDAGVHERLTLLYNERCGTVAATANPAVLESASACFSVAFEAWEALSETYADRSQFVGNDLDPHTLLYWKKTKIEDDGSLACYDDKRNYRGSIQIRNMEDVITALIPYTTVCGSSSSVVHELSVSASVIADTTQTIHPFRQERFLVAVLVRTSAYQNSRHSSKVDDEICTVSESPMARNKCLADNDMAGTGTYNRGVGEAELRRTREESRNDITITMQKLKSWMIDEKSITIPLRLYCWTALALCTILVFGGLAIGLTVQERIRGVDPSNISMFCWALAGFFTVVAKSVRVENWPWRDFLLGRVVCRSITEVCQASNAKPQVLLAILLQLQHMMILEKRGPFHAIFGRKADDGLSIDVPLETGTLIDGGFIPIRVQSTDGPALALLHVPPWGDNASVQPQGTCSDGEMVICRNMREPWESEKTNLPRYQLCSNRLQWFRVHGIYKKDVEFC